MNDILTSITETMAGIDWMDPFAGNEFIAALAAGLTVIAFILRVSGVAGRVFKWIAKRFVSKPEPPPERPYDKHRRQRQPDTVRKRMKDGQGGKGRPFSISAADAARCADAVKPDVTNQRAARERLSKSMAAMTELARATTVPMKKAAEAMGEFAKAVVSPIPGVPSEYPPPPPPTVAPSSILCGTIMKIDQIMSDGGRDSILHITETDGRKFTQPIGERNDVWVGKLVPINLHTAMEVTTIDDLPTPPEGGSGEREPGLDIWFDECQGMMDAGVLESPKPLSKGDVDKLRKSLEDRHTGPMLKPLELTMDTSPILFETTEHYAPEALNRIMKKLKKAHGDRHIVILPPGMRPAGGALKLPEGVDVEPFKGSEAPSSTIEYQNVTKVLEPLESISEWGGPFDGIVSCFDLQGFKARPPRKDRHEGYFTLTNTNPFKVIVEYRYIRDIIYNGDA